MSDYSYNRDAVLKVFSDTLILKKFDNLKNHANHEVDEKIQTLMKNDPKSSDQPFKLWKGYSTELELQIARCEKEKGTCETSLNKVNASFGEGFIGSIQRLASSYFGTISELTAVIQGLDKDTVALKTLLGSSNQALRNWESKDKGAEELIQKCKSLHAQSKPLTSRPNPGTLIKELDNKIAQLQSERRGYPQIQEMIEQRNIMNRLVKL